MTTTEKALVLAHEMAEDKPAGDICTSCPNMTPGGPAMVTLCWNCDRGDMSTSDVGSCGDITREAAQMRLDYGATHKPKHVGGARWRAIKRQLRH